MTALDDDDNSKASALSNRGKYAVKIRRQALELITLHQQIEEQQELIKHYQAKLLDQESTRLLPHLSSCRKQQEALKVDEERESQSQALIKQIQHLDKKIDVYQNLVQKNIAMQIHEKDNKEQIISWKSEKSELVAEIQALVQMNDRQNDLILTLEHELEETKREKSSIEHRLLSLEKEMKCLMMRANKTTEKNGVELAEHQVGADEHHHHRRNKGKSTSTTITKAKPFQQSRNNNHQRRQDDQYLRRSSGVRKKTMASSSVDSSLPSMQQPSSDYRGSFKQMREKYSSQGQISHQNDYGRKESTDRNENRQQREDDNDTYCSLQERVKAIQETYHQLKREELLI